MTPHPKALEAACLAFRTCLFDTDTCVEAAITAYFDTLAAEGLSREAMCEPRLFSGLWDASEKLPKQHDPDSIFPVTIIRKVQP